MHIDVEFYTTIDGKKPAKEFLMKLDPKMRAKLIKTIELLEANGPDLRMAIKYKHDYESREGEGNE